MKPKLSDGEKIRRRKVAEDEFLKKWRGNLSAHEARLDLFRFYLRRGIITLAEFRRIRGENNLNDKDSYAN
jgi:hypothetical protein